MVATIVNTIGLKVDFCQRLFMVILGYPMAYPTNKDFCKLERMSKAAKLVLCGQNGG